MQVTDAVTPRGDEVTDDIVGVTEAVPVVMPVGGRIESGGTEPSAQR